MNVLYNQWRSLGRNGLNKFGTPGQFLSSFNVYGHKTCRVMNTHNKKCLIDGVRGYKRCNRSIHIRRLEEKHSVFCNYNGPYFECVQLTNSYNKIIVNYNKLGTWF